MAELVKLTTADNKTLFGAFYPPEGKKIKKQALIMVHGMTGTFTGEIEGAVPPLVAQKGIAVLAANNRGTGFMGAATETISGVIPDIQAMLDFLSARGFEEIVLLGHSKAGAKVSYYLSQTGDERIKALCVLSSVPSFRALPQWLAVQFSPKNPKRWIKRARKAAERGNGAEIYTHSEWPYIISAGTVADHSLAENDDVLTLITRANLPVLAACGSMELDWCTVVSTLLSGAPEHIRVEVVEGADHVYSGREVQLADLLIDWITSLKLS